MIVIPETIEDIKRIMVACRDQARQLGLKEHHDVDSCQCCLCFTYRNARKIALRIGEENVHSR